MKKNNGKRRVKLGLTKKGAKLYVGIGALAVIIVAALVLFSSSGGERTIKIGVIAPLSGGPSLWGQGSLNMIRMAVDEINAHGGVNGKKLVIIPEDGKCQPQPAITAAQKLISVDNVKFILGGHCSPETAALAPLAEENRVFMLAGVSTATGILDKYSYAFRTSPPNRDQACLIGKVALEQGLQRVAVLTASTAFTKSISNDFINCFQEEGGKIVRVEEYVWPDTTDFKTNLLKIKEEHPDAIFVSSQGTEGVQILKQMKELGMNATLTGNTVFISKKTYAASDGLLPETAFTLAPYVERTRASSLISKYKARYGEDVPYNLFFVGAAYDGVYMLKDALEACGEETACVKEYFSNLKDWQGVTAQFSFQPNGDPILHNWRVLRVKDGQTVFEKLS